MLQPVEDKPATPKKVRITTPIAPEVLSDVRRAVYHTHRMMMWAFVESALARETERLEKQYEKQFGKPFPKGEKVLKSGCPFVLRKP